ncbi:chromosomal replication initiator protein DnaA [Catenisphaera adipataccumulans]|uniref:Chromosomal replication initiator protein DnaA n=1 Tax=Catenisphaera adipataccumulans TaxID=700500 RepID=A0A7W8FYC0_9FIRM|nr:chromosomal replication initiator protein DnaA [Catenisphaera adipataccumulans]MBB5183847.1 chromosomal replication initiator protein [Catenisphaera adipataccumulans]
MAVNSYDQIWQETLDAVHARHFFSEDTFNDWVRKTTLFKIENNEAYVAYRSMITKNIIAQPEAHTLFESTLSKVWGDAVSIRFIDYHDMEKLMPEEIVKQRTSEMIQSHFDPHYTFESFVEGKSNQEAYAACMSCCTQARHLYNPIMLYGNSGLGKTHLLHAIGNYLQKEKPEVKVFYAYSGDLVSILLDAMKTKSVHGNTVEMVQSQLIDNDYFLIDDIQNLTQSSSQEVFFKVYNALIAKNAQIVITSDMHPNQLSGLQSRLVSRFAQGLIVNIQKPEFDTARAILQMKLKGYEESHDVTDEVIDFLAHKFSDDVRKLEGSLNKLIFSATIENPDVIDIDFARKILDDEIIQSKPDHLSPNKIKKEVSKFYGLSYAAIEGKSRLRKLVTARHMIVYLTREILGSSWTAIGQELGNRDHSTIKSSYERGRRLMETDEAFRMACEKIRSQLE